MGEYGYNIEHILMVDIIPDPSVRTAMNEINAGDDYCEGILSAILVIYYKLSGHILQHASNEFLNHFF